MSVANILTYRSIRSLMPPTEQMAADLTEGKIYPVPSFALLKERYDLSNEYHALRAFREAICIFAEAVGTVLVLVDPTSTKIIGYVDDPATEYDDQQMDEARYKLFALLTPQILELYNVIHQVEGRERLMDYCVALMPRYDYQEFDAPFFERYAIHYFHFKVG